MAEHELQPQNNQMLVDYARFLRRKRDACTAEVAAEIKELKENRLFEDTYTLSDVEAILDGLNAVLRTTLKRDVQNMSHSGILLLKQTLEQVEKAGTEVYLDLPSIEDRSLLQAVEDWEMNSSSAGSLRARATNVSRPSAGPALPTIGQAQDPQVIAALQAQQEENVGLAERFQKLQVQCTSILKEKSAMQVQIEALTAANAVSSGAVASSSDEVNMLQQQLAQLQAELQAVSADRSEQAERAAGSEALLAELQAAKAREADLLRDLEDSRAEATARIEKSKQFLSLRQMLAKKTALVRQLREQCQAAGLDLGDVEVVED